MTNLLDANFQSRYFKLPIATHVVLEPPYTAHDTIATFVHKHYHKEFEVIGVISGSCQFTIGPAVYQAEKGDLIFVPPYSLHFGAALPGEAHSHFCFCFDLSLLQNKNLEKQFESGSLNIRHLLKHSLPEAALLFDIASRVYQQCEAMLSGWEYVVQGQLLTLFGLLEQQDHVISNVHGNRQGDFCHNILNILSQYYNQDISSHSIAAQLSYTQSYFCRKFRDAFGLTFQQYLNQYRLSKARLFLAQENISVGEAARKAGFHHTDYFVRQFHAAYGCTPKQFQKSQVKANNFQSYYL